MASGDATPFPKKNTAYRVTFPILDADGDLVTGATGLDSEVSKDGGTFADCTSEATEIATSSGMYYLDLTSTEMNADTVAIIVKTSSSGAKTTALVMYPVESTDIDVNVTAFGGTAGTFSAGRPEVNTTHWGGTAVASAVIPANTIQISGDSVAADNAESFFDGTGYAGTNNTIPTVGSVSGSVGGSVGSIASGGITSASFASGAITSTAIAADAIGASELAADAVAEIADAVWDEVISGHLTGGSTGAALNAAGSAGDPWTTTLPGAYTGSQAGKMLSDILTDTAEIGAAGAGLTALAPASTALSSATWTTARAGYLDALNGGIVVKRNTALANFEFLMVLSSDHVTGATGKTITATRSIDGGAFASCTNSASEVSSGVYKISLSAADLNGTTVTLRFVAASCDDTFITILTQP